MGKERNSRKIGQPEQGSTPEILDLFPVSEKAAFRTLSISTNKDIRRETTRLFRENGLLPSALIFLAEQERSRLYCEHLFDPLTYIFGAISCYAALRHEASLKGGKLPTLSEEGIRTYVDHLLPTEEYRELAERFQAMRIIAEQQAGQSSSNAQRVKAVERFYDHQEIDQTLDMVNSLTRLADIERMLQFSVEEPVLADLAISFFGNNPPIATSTMLAFVDITNIFKTFLEIKKIKSMNSGN